MTTYKNILTFTEINFSNNFEMEGEWRVSPSNLIVRNTEKMHKYETFETIEDLKKFVRTKFNYFKRKGLKRGCSGSVLIETL